MNYIFNMNHILPTLHKFLILNPYKDCKNNFHIKSFRLQADDSFSGWLFQKPTKVLLADDKV
jgi:hypothetical protein